MDAPSSWSTTKSWTQSVKSESDQLAAEHLISLANDITYSETVVGNDGYYVDAYIANPEECEVTEEVITDDWVQTSGQDSVEIAMDSIVGTVNVKQEVELDIPLPTDQDEYTAMRPWPCDFCSRRFRKKAALMNHMVEHQNDRPFGCNLCGVRYVRKTDLMNHLKVHAFAPDHTDDDSAMAYMDIEPKKKRGRRKKRQSTPSPENGLYEDMRSARTQQWQRKSKPWNGPQRTPPRVLTPLSPKVETSPPPMSRPLPSDPSKPFVCIHCGVGFAREKALQSHARIHGGESPIECSACGELVWSKEALREHVVNKHPTFTSSNEEQYDYDGGEESDFSLPLSDSESDDLSSDISDNVKETLGGPEKFCNDCGVAFQRADLLRKHFLAAHSHKRESNQVDDNWSGSHSCEVCGDTFEDALQLLAHAGCHARTHRKKRRSGKTQLDHLASSNNVRQFPCLECGKTFGSRSSQQIHVRIHTGERPYACRFCWKAFADGGTLRKHERIHTGEKPYACAVCNRAFNQRVVLREHIRSHHSAPDTRRNVGFSCIVCGRVLDSSAELVQHLIQHCDANTAMKRQPQAGPRKYKRRKKVQDDFVINEVIIPDIIQKQTFKVELCSNEETEKITPTRTKRQKKQQQKEIKEDTPRMRDINMVETRSTRSRPGRDKTPPEPGAPFTCEMCDLKFDRRAALLLHVPIHI